MNLQDLRERATEPTLDLPWIPVARPDVLALLDRIEAAEKLLAALDTGDDEICAWCGWPWCDHDTDTCAYAEYRAKYGEEA